MRDIVVVIPGITGSVLRLRGKEVWGLSAGSIVRALLTLGGSVEALALPRDLGDAEPEDGVEASALMPDLHGIPGLWGGIDGYSVLLRFLEERFELKRATREQAGNLVLFPYDWRLSNVASARRLKETVEPALERWQEDPRGGPEARLVLVCHSMGGLVARHFVEVLKGAEITRQVITIGTPYQGSIDALDALANGVHKGLGALRMNLTSFVRTLPAAYQLLPTYPCLDAGSGRLERLGDRQLPDVDVTLVRQGLAFHERIASKIEERQRAGRPFACELVAIKGQLQPTAQSVMLTRDGIEPRRDYLGEDRGGDGTVPRPSAHPFEWEHERSGHVIFSAQKHASLQNTADVHHQLHGWLTSGRLGTWMGGEKLAVDLPDLILAGEELPIQVSSENEMLALLVRAEEANGAARRDEPLRNLGGGRYRASIADLPPGGYRVTVESMPGTTSVDPVTSVCVVWDSTATLSEAV